MNKFTKFPGNILWLSKINYYIAEPIDCSNPPEDVVRRLKRFLKGDLTADEFYICTRVFCKHMRYQAIADTMSGWSAEDVIQATNNILDMVSSKPNAEYISGSKYVGFHEYGANNNTRDTSYPRGLYKEIGINEYYFEHIDYDNPTQEQLEGLEFAISKLPVLQQMYIDLRYKQHMTYGQVADEAGASFNSVKNSIHKATRCLRTSDSLRACIVDGVSAYKEEAVDEKSYPKQFISDSKLSTRAKNTLTQWGGFVTLQDVVDYVSTYECWYARIRSCGKRTALEVMNYLEKSGLVDRNNKGWMGLAEWKGKTDIDTIVDYIKDYDLDTVQLAEVKRAVSKMIAAKREVKQ